MREKKRINGRLTHLGEVYNESMLQVSPTFFGISYSPWNMDTILVMAALLYS